MEEQGLLIGAGAGFPVQNGAETDGFNSGSYWNYRHDYKLNSLIGYRLRFLPERKERQAQFRTDDHIDRAKNKKCNQHNRNIISKVYADGLRRPRLFAQPRASAGFAYCRLPF